MCGGASDGAHTTPGPTIISAIDGAVLTYDSTWDKRPQGYPITSTVGYSQTVNRFWGGPVGYNFVDKGECQFKVAARATVLGMMLLAILS